MPKDHEELLRLAAERFKTASTADQKERLEADEDVRFAINDDGCQWPAETRAEREHDYPPRPCLSLNKIPEKIDVVDGEFKGLKPSVKVRAIDSQADPKIADVIAGIIRHIEYNSQARTSYNTAYTSVLYSGRGAWRIDIEDDEDDPFVRSIRINRIPNALSVYWDQESKKQDKSDSRYVFVTDTISKKQFEVDYPDINVNDWPSDDIWDTWHTEETVRIAEYWWREQRLQTYYKIKREVNGLPMTLTVKEPKPLDEIVEEKKVKRPKIKWCKMVANQVIDGPYDDWPSRFIPIVLCFGKTVNVRGQDKSRGMVRFARTPQQMYNYWSSSITEQIALAPKSPYLVTAAMIGPYRKQWDEAHVRNFPYLLHDVDPDSPSLSPRREPPPAMSSAVAHELQRMDHDIMSAMGIYEASLGQEAPERSGRAILARQKQGNIASAPYTENFHMALTYSTRILIDLIPYVYDTERIIRIVGSDDVDMAIPINARPNAPMLVDMPKPDMKYVSGPREGVTEYLNDLTVGKYDVVVDIGPSYTTQRQEALEQLMELVQAAPQLAQVAIDIIIENMDLPQSEKLLERARKMVPLEIRGLEDGEQPPPPPPPDPLILLQQKDLEIKAADQQRKAYETQVDAMKTMAETQLLAQQQQLGQIMAILEGIKTHFDMGSQAQQMEMQAQQQAHDQSMAVMQAQMAGQTQQED
jgi:hypothetical protein